MGEGATAITSEPTSRLEPESRSEKVRDERLSPPEDDPERPEDDDYAKLGDLRLELEAGLRARLERRPYATLGLAFGAGYVAGAGIPGFAARLVGGLVLRFAALELMREGLQTWRQPR